MIGKYLKIFQGSAFNVHIMNKMIDLDTEFYLYLTYRTWTQAMNRAEDST